MCVKEDTEWLDDFYERILNQTDPLALYRRATESPYKKPNKKQPDRAGNATDVRLADRRQNGRKTARKKSTREAVGYMIILSVFIIVIILLMTGISY